MKRLILLLLVLFFSREGFMSGAREEVALKNVLQTRNNVYVVNIIGSYSVTIKEIKKKVQKNDRELADKVYYAAKIVAIINKGDSSRNDKESWTMLFSPRELDVLKKIKTVGIEKICPSDTIFIMDGDDLSRSITYYVNGEHKIFIYDFCADAASEIKPGNSYIFISDGAPSKNSGVFYGNVGYGLYPDSNKMRNKIAKILAKSHF
jgi:hypothetical protein